MNLLLPRTAPSFDDTTRPVMRMGLRENLTVGVDGKGRERERKKWQVSLMHLLASQNLHPENSPGLDALSAIDKPDIGEHQV